MIRNIKHHSSLPVGLPCCPEAFLTFKSSIIRGSAFVVNNLGEVFRLNRTQLGFLVWINLSNKRARHHYSREGMYKLSRAEANPGEDR